MSGGQISMLSKQERNVRAFILDSLQSSSEKTPFSDFAYLDEKVKQKVKDMQGNAADQKN